MGQYRAIVDLLGHRELGGKNLLFLIDGLFAGYYWDSHPYKWKTAHSALGQRANGPPAYLRRRTRWPSIRSRMTFC